LSDRKKPDEILTFLNLTFQLALMLLTID